MLTPLTIAHADQVATMLANYFKHQNEFLGIKYYQESMDTMKKHVTKRLHKQWPVRYMGFVEKGRVIGFINYFENTEDNALEIRWFVGDFTEGQLQHAMNYLYDLYKEKGFSKISTEFADNEPALINAFRSMGGLKVQSGYIIK